MIHLFGFVRMISTIPLSWVATVGNVVSGRTGFFGWSTSVCDPRSTIVDSDRV